MFVEVTHEAIHSRRWGEEHWGRIVRSADNKAVLAYTVYMDMVLEWLGVTWPRDVIVWLMGGVWQ